ncbi:MAG: hypothetical protein ABII79_07625 [bacterium]
MLPAPGRTAIAAGDGGDARARGERVIRMSLPQTNADTSSNFEAGTALVFVPATDDISEGYGLAVVIDYTRLSPLILRGVPQVFWYELNLADLPKQKFASLSADVDLLLRVPGSEVRPYFGGGFSAYSNMWPTDEPATGESAPYDDATLESYHDFGQGLAWHLRAGSDFRFSQRVWLRLDFKYSYARPELDLEIIDQVTGENSRRARQYDMTGPTVMLGVNWTLHP